MAGIIKMVEAMRHGVLPRSLHIDQPTTHVDWNSGAVRLLTTAVDWPETGRPRRAAVSSFGISGTNAHIILEQAPEPDDPHPDTAGEPGGVWLLSAKGGPALQAQATRLADWIHYRPHLTTSQVGWSLWTTRSQLPDRAAVVGQNRLELFDALTALAEGRPHPGVTTGNAAGTGPVMVFPGQGSQWVGMGRRLLADSPVFAARIAECEQALQPWVDWSLTETLSNADDLDRVDIVQPVLWAVMVSLAEVWAQHGVRPAAVVGHSQGEIAAAVVAGALSLTDGARVVAERSRILRSLSGRGAMASIHLPEAEVRALLSGQVAVAATNSPTMTVISGPREQVDAIVQACDSKQIRARRIDVDYASHHPDIDTIADTIVEQLTGIQPGPGQVAFYSTVTAARIDSTELTADYWATNLRQPVRFADTIQTLLNDGHTTFIEASPHPVLTTAISETSDRAVTIPTLRRDHDTTTQIHTALAHAHTNGITIDWTPLYPATPTRIDLPTYAFQTERFWPASAPVGADGWPAGSHALLPVVVELADGSVALTGRVSATSRGWLVGHVAGGVRLLPGAALLEWVLRAADAAGCAAVEELVLQAPLVLPEQGGLRLQVLVGADEDGGGRRPVRVLSRPDDGARWLCHAEGVLTGHSGEAEGLTGAWPPPGARAVSLDGFYARADHAGYGYGPSYQGLRAVWRDGDDLYAEVGLPGQAGGPDGFGIHPALLDAALHPLLPLTDHDATGQLWLPFAWNGVTLWATGATTVRVRLSREGGHAVRVVVADPTGEPVLTAESLATWPTSAVQLREAAHGREGLYRVEWSAAPDAAAPPERLATLDVPPGGDERAAVDGALRHLQQWLRDPANDDARLVVTTHGAVLAGDEAAADLDLAGAAVIALVRSAEAEHPGRFALVDLEPGAGLALSTVLGDEPQIAVRGGKRLAARLVPAAGEADSSTVDGGGTILVAGGTGTLGGLLAEHLVSAHGAKHLVLASRTGPAAPGADDLRRRLGERGADVRIAAVDLSDPVAVAGLVGGIDPPLTGIVHAAGVLADAVVTAQDAETVERVWRAKATVVRNLDEATRGMPLTMFTVMSSAAALLGAAGQANYAAANAYCDALVARRRGMGLAGLSIGWGLWDAASTLTRGLGDSGRTRLLHSGIRPLGTPHALALFDRAHRQRSPYLLAADLDRRNVANHTGVLRTLAVDRAVTRRTASRAAAADLATEFGRMEPADRFRTMLALVRGHAAAVLGHTDPERVASDRGFLDMGFDSLTAIQLRNGLTSATGLRLPNTLVFDHPNPAALAEHLLEQLGPQQTDPVTPLLREWARLEKAMLDASRDGEARSTFARRVQTTLSLVSGPPDGTDPAADLVASAGRQALFDFIDTTLGRVRGGD
nr:type I polyketide synthase [Phytohabitans suffuscus]